MSMGANEKIKCQTIPSVSTMAKHLEELEAVAGEHGWGGEFREEMFDNMLLYLTDSPQKKRSLGALLAYLLSSNAAAIAKKEIQK